MTSSAKATPAATQETATQSLVKGEEAMTSTSNASKAPLPGQTVINDDVIGAIANTAAREVEGVASLGEGSVRRLLAEKLGSAERRSRGVGVVSGRREAIIDLELNVIYGYTIPDIVEQVRENVSERVSELCGLDVKETNIVVRSIEFAYGHPSRFAQVE